MISYNNIVSRFEKFVENHHILREFSHGSPEDLDQTKEPEYPLLHLVLTNVSYPDRSIDSLGTSKTYSLTLFILSLPPDKIDKTSYQKEVISDSIKIAEDVIADVINGFNIFKDSHQYYLSGVSLEPMEEETKNTLAGVMMTLDLTVPYTYDACDLPLEGVDEPGLVDCEDATYRNSDGTFVQAIDSGATFTSEDITVTEVDGTTKDVPSNKDITCLWKTLQLESSDGVDIFLDGQVNNDVLTYPGGGAIAVSNLNVRDSDGFNTSYPRRSRLVISGAAIQGVAQDAVSTTITVPTVPTQSGILYQQIMPQHFRTSYNVGDTAWHWQKGTYNRTPPSYPEAVAEIDYTAVQSDVRAIPAPGTTANDSVSPTMLKENNAFGNKYRFTDSAGNPSDSTANSLFAHTDWLNHSFSGAIQDYIIDHLFGLGQITRYIQDGSKTSLAVNDPDGQSIDDWIAYVHTANLKGLSGWRLPDLTTSMASILGANFFPNSSEWAGNTFFSERTDNRFSAALCEALASNFYLQMNDSNGSQFPVYRVARTQDLGFASDICHVFPVRNHY